MVDGGVREVAPVKLAKELGAEQIFVILASPSTVSYRVTRNIGDIAGRITDLLVSEILQSDVTLGLGDEGWMKNPGPVGHNATVIYPRFAVHDGMVIDPELIRINADYGWMVASDALRGLTRERTVQLLDTAGRVTQSLVQDISLSRELTRNRADFTSQAEWERARYNAATRGRELTRQAVEQRHKAGGEIPERIRPFLQGGGRAAPKISGVSVPSVVGRTATQATAQLRELGLESHQRVGRPGSRWRQAGIVVTQDPPAGRRLSAGCAVTLTLTPDQGPPPVPQPPRPTPGPSPRPPVHIP